MSSSRSCRPRRPKRNRAEFGAGGRPGETTHANHDGFTGRAENRPGTEIFKGGFGFVRGPRGPLPIHPCHLAIATEHSMHRNIFFATILILAAPVAAADIQQPPTDPPAGQTETPPAETSPATEGGDGFAAHDTEDRKSTRQNSSHECASRMQSNAWKKKT